MGKVRKKNHATEKENSAEEDSLRNEKSFPSEGGRGDRHHGTFGEDGNRTSLGIGKGSWNGDNGQSRWTNQPSAISKGWQYALKTALLRDGCGGRGQEGKSQA